MTDAATRLAEAKDALHDLLRGVQVRELRDQNGEIIVYARADVPRLRAYIIELEREAATTPVGQLWPLRPVF